MIIDGFCSLFPTELYVAVLMLGNKNRTELTGPVSQTYSG